MGAAYIMCASFANEKSEKFEKPSILNVPPLNYAYKFYTRNEDIVELRIIA